MSNAGSGDTKNFAGEQSRADQTRLQSTVHANLAAAFPDTQDFQTSAANFPHLPDCHIVGVLGRGGMGIVYKALQTQLNREVAVKTILATIADSPMVVARFFTEAEAMAAVQHPHVAQVFGFGESQGMPYLVMELLTGGTLAQRLAERKVLPPDEAVRLVEKVARAVGVVHERNIVHRDLKPGNIMFDGHGEPKLTDFGLAKRADSNLTVTDLQMGTPYYMAPEQADGQAKFVGPPADVWALGVLLYECLTGVRPFEGANSPSVVHQVIHGDAKPLRKVSAKLPRDLETICQKCLSKESASRYATGTELADELTRWLTGQPILARRTPPVERLVLWARRKPMHALAWVLVPLTVLLVTFGAVLFQMWQSAETANRNVTRAKEQLTLLSRIRQRTLQPKPGWSWATQDDVKAFGRLDPDAGTVADLRTDAVAAATAIDFREAAPLTTGFPVGSIAASPDGRWVAVGEFKPGLWLIPIPVHLFDAKTGREERVVRLPPGVVFNILKGKPSQDILLHLAFSRDGNHLFAGAKSGRLHHWDLTTDAVDPVRWWSAGREIRSMAPTPDGKYLYTLATRGGVQKWVVATGKPATDELKADTLYGALALHPTTGDVFAGLGSDLFLLDPMTLRGKSPSVPFAPHAIHHLRFHPSGNWLAVAAGNTIQVVDASTRKPTATFIDPVLKTAAHRGKVEHLELHPSGAVLVSLSDDTEDHTLKVWAVPSGKLIGSAAIPGEGLMSLALSPDGGTISVGTSVQTHRFELRGPALLARHVPHAGPVEAVAWLPDGRGVAALSRRPAVEGDPKKHFLLSLLQEQKPVDYPFSLAAIGEGRFGLATLGDRVAVTTCCNDTVVWSSQEPTAHRTLAVHSPLLPRFQPSGDRLWVVEDGVTQKSWNPGTGSAGPAWSNNVANVLKGAAGIQAAAAGPTRLAAGTRDGSVVVIDPNSAEVQTRYDGTHGPVTSMAMSRDETLVVAGLYAGKVRTVRLADGVEEEEAFAAHRDTVSAVALGDGATGRYLATGSSDRSIRLFQRTKSGWQPLFALNDLGAGVTSLEFSPDGGRLLFGCAGDLGYRVLDVEKLHAELAKVGFGWK